MTSSYRHVQVSVDHPLATMNRSYRKRSNSVLMAEHRLVLWDKIGYGPHLCHWCQRPLRWAPGERRGGDVLVADHVDTDTSNNDPANLVPSCASCNSHRSRRLAADDLFVIDARGKRSRAVRIDCAQCGESFLLRAVYEGKRRFCSPACAGKGLRRGPRGPYRKG